MKRIRHGEDEQLDFPNGLFLGNLPNELTPKELTKTLGCLSCRVFTETRTRRSVGEEDFDEVITLVKTYAFATFKNAAEAKNAERQSWTFSGRVAKTHLVANQKRLRPQQK